jgi:hypothetical protein
MNYFEYLPNEVNTIILSKINDEMAFNNMNKSYIFNDNIYKEIITQEYPKFYSFIISNNGTINKELYYYFRFKEKLIDTIPPEVLDNDYSKTINLNDPYNTLEVGTLKYITVAEIPKIIELLNKKLKEKNLVLRYTFHSKYNDIYQIIKNDSSFWDYREYILGILSNRPLFKYYENYSNHLYANITACNTCNGIFNIDKLLSENIKNMINFFLKYNIQFHSFDRMRIDNIPYIIYLKLKQYSDIDNNWLNNIFKYDTTKKMRMGLDGVIQFREYDTATLFIKRIFFLKSNKEGMDTINLLLNQQTYPYIRSLKNIKNSSYPIYIKIIIIFIEEYGFDMDDIILNIQ